MIRHNLLITFRGFLRHKSSFIINLIGLSTGLACVLMIYFWVRDEMRIDSFHEQNSQLYQIMSHIDFKDDIQTFESSPTPLAKALETEFPEVSMAVTLNDFFTWDNNPEGLLAVDAKETVARGLHASRDFFSLFSFPLLHGDPSSVLAHKNNIAISRKTAEKFFDSPAAAIGKMLEWNHPGFSGTYQVSGIFEDPPSYSTLQFEVVFTIELLYEKDRWSHDWGGHYGKAFVRLEQGTSLPAFNQKIAKFLTTKHDNSDNFTLFARRFSDKYLYNTYQNGVQAGGRITYVRLFSLIALFILLIACINFMNLSTAKASLKMKEIGVKKTIGAERKHLISQLLGESLILSFLGVWVAFGIAYAIMPHFNTLTGKSLSLYIEANDLGILCGIVLLTGLLAGSYPAFYLSGFRPIFVLKGRLPNKTSDLLIRKGLVVFQFVLTIGFLVGLLVINQQISYTQKKNLGYDRNNLIQFSWKGELYSTWEQREMGKDNQVFQTFCEGLKNIPGVSHASSMTGDILSRLYNQSGVSWEGMAEGESYSITSPVIGEDAIETLGIEVLAGRSFSAARNDTYNKIIVNEAFAKKMGVDNPVGMSINWNGQSEIIGLVKDFHYGSLHNPLEPLFFRFEPHGRTLMVKLEGKELQPTLERIEAYHAEHLPGMGFDFTFMDEAYQQLYESEMRVGSLANYFAVIAIILSCLGLFGLAAFTAERRTKEIGIRKVMGASVTQLVHLLSVDFTKMVLLAIVIAVPISYLGSSYWLEGFSEKIPLHGWYFVAASAATLLIAWLTVSVQTFKAASLNPVACLKDE